MDTPTLASLGIPVAFLLVGALGKCLSHSEVRTAHFCLGLEAALASMSGAVIYAIDLTKEFAMTTGASPAAAEISQSQTYNMYFLVAAFLAYLVIVTTHMVNEKETVSNWRKFWMLLIVANICGLASLSAFVIIVKG